MPTLCAENLDACLLGCADGGVLLHVRTLLLAALLAACLALPAALPSGLGLGTIGDGVFTTDQKGSFFTPIATPVWWDYSVVDGVPTGVQERDGAFDINVPQGHSVLAIAETLPVSTPDTPKVCLPVNTPETVVPAAVVHEINCVKDNGYTVSIHYFPWSNDPTDPDHVQSITLGTPLAPLAWRVDAVTLSYKTALLPAGHWQVWIDPTTGPPLGFNVAWEFQSVDGTPFYFDNIGWRGCPFYAEVAPGVSDQALLGCIDGYT
jgi:hypothetical protein